VGRSGWYGHCSEEQERPLTPPLGVLSLKRQTALRVKPTELDEQIEQALVRSAETDAQGITVEMEGS